MLDHCQVLHVLLQRPGGGEEVRDNPNYWHQNHRHQVWSEKWKRHFGLNLNVLEKTAALTVLIQRRRLMRMKMEGKLIFWLSVSELSLYQIQGVSKKNAPLCLTGLGGYQKWTMGKSRVSFEKFRKFPFWWAQKLLIFVRKWLRKMRPKMPTPLEKRHAFGSYKDLLHLLPFQ